MSGTRKRLKRNITAQKLKAKQLSARMKAKARRRRERNVDTVTETPISLRSKFAWVTIVLMVLVIVAASIQVHPAHCRVEYAMTETGENPYMGTLDAQDGYLKSLPLTWAQVEPEDGKFVLPDAEQLDGGRSYVALLDAGELPAHVREAAANADDAQKYVAGRLRDCVKEVCRLLAERGDCAYLQTDAELENTSAQISGIYLLCLAADGLYRAPDGGDGSWLTSPVAGSGAQIFGNHLTYVLDGGDGEPLAGRVGWALGVRYAEWHSFTGCGDRLFVNMTLDNAGVTAAYQPMELVLSLWRGGEMYARETQTADLRSLTDEPLAVDGYIDMPYNLEKGTYTLCVSVCARGGSEPIMSLTMPEGSGGYYELGRVSVR